MWEKVYVEGCQIGAKCNMLLQKVLLVNKQSSVATATRYVVYRHCWIYIWSWAGSLWKSYPLKRLALHREARVVLSIHTSLEADLQTAFLYFFEPTTVLLQESSLQRSGVRYEFLLHQTSLILVHHYCLPFSANIVLMWTCQLDSGEKISGRLSSWLCSEDSLRWRRWRF